MIQFIERLRDANIRRSVEWGGDKITPLFKAVELGGEVGELLNVVKKWERERLGIAGSRATREQGVKEIGDVLICLDRLALDYGISLEEAAVHAFNTTSEQVGLKTRL